MSTEERRVVNAVRSQVVTLMREGRLEGFQEEYADRKGLLRENEPKPNMTYPNIQMPKLVYGLKSY